MNKISTTFAGVATLALALSLAACGKQQEPGPAEALGKKIDSTVQEAGKQLEQATDKAKEQSSDTGSKLGQAVDQAKVDAKDAYEKTKEGAKDLTQKAGEKMQQAGEKISEASKK